MAIPLILFDAALGTERDRARFMLGDTGALLDDAGGQVWLLQDETLDALIETYGFREAVALAADGLVARFAQEPDSYADEGGVKVEWRERIDAWRDLAKRMRVSAVGDVASVIQGGRYESAPSTGPDMSALRL